MDTLKFLELITKLKRLKRTGWVLYGIPDSESVADHTCGVTLLALALSHTLQVDQNKMIKMALLHDLGEAIIGDIPTVRGRDIQPKAAQKKIDEAVALKASLAIGGLEILQPLVDELASGKTREAKLVNQLDKLDMAYQALAYEGQTNKRLQEFFENAAMIITEPALKQVLRKILASRPKLKTSPDAE